MGRIDGDLVPYASGTSHLGVDGNSSDAFDIASIMPWGHIHQNSGVFHNPFGSSGVIRFGNSGLECSQDGGKTYLRLAAIPVSANDNDVFFCKGNALATDTLGLTFNPINDILGVSGLLAIKSRSIDLNEQPPNNARPSGVTLFSAINLAERPMLGALNANTGMPTIFQPALFNRLIVMAYTDQTTTVGSYGSRADTIGTVSHTTPTTASGLMLNFKSNNSVNDVAGIGGHDLIFARGSMSGINTGFFFATRMTLPDDAYARARFYVGLTNGTARSAVDADNPTGDLCGFQFSTERPDVNWQFMTKDNVTQRLQDTGMSCTPDRIYDMYIYCPPFPNNGVIYWTIHDVSWNRVKSGYAVLNLPRTEQLMRYSVFLANVVNVGGKNIRFTHIYCEST